MEPHRLFIPAGILFVLHQVLQKICQISIPAADQYLDPLLCMPILLGIWQWEQAFLFQRRISVSEIWVLTVLLSLLFEVGFPRFSSHFTADWKDGLLYFLGSALFISARSKQQ